jgi:hypothetical protein
LRLEKVPRGCAKGLFHRQISRKGHVLFYFIKSIIEGSREIAQAVKVIRLTQFDPLSDEFLVISHQIYSVIAPGKRQSMGVYSATSRSAKKAIAGKNFTVQ